MWEFIRNFEKDTGLKLREHFAYHDNEYVECSGKSYSLICKIIHDYNYVHKTHIMCYDDYSRDATFIVF